jgi:NhaA family Na+:H+ antiporter
MRLVGPPRGVCALVNHSAATRNPSRTQYLAERAFATVERFLHIEAVSGVALLVAATLALIWANSSFAHSYHALWHMPVAFGIGEFTFSRSLHFWINDALMTIFFLVVGMEIRREIHEGALSKLDQAALPIAAAIGGVIAPALIYLAFNGDPERVRGWAVPTATDIAFAVGVLALLGRSIPSNVRVFLLALAIIDDLIAVLIIAFFYWRPGPERVRDRRGRHRHGDRPATDRRGFSIRLCGAGRGRMDRFARHRSPPDFGWRGSRPHDARLFDPDV